MEFSRVEYWNGLPFPSPGDLLNPGIEPKSPALQVDSLPAEPPGKPIIQNRSHYYGGWKFYNLQSANWRTKNTSGVIFSLSAGECQCPSVKAESGFSLIFPFFFFSYSGPQRIG